jgi:hypothetical protein
MDLCELVERKAEAMWPMDALQSLLGKSGEVVGGASTYLLGKSEESREACPGEKTRAPSMSPND